VRLAPAHSDTLKLQELERRAILEALRRTKSHQAKAADLLGITDRTLREKLRRYRADGKWPKKNDTKGERSCQELPA
jgi:DNA-binding NtrC family response regulator